MSRFEYIKTLNLEEMISYMEQEIGDGVPTDIREWLSERIEEGASA